MLAHPGLQRIEPVLAEQWNRSVLACSLLHGVISYGGRANRRFGFFQTQEITPPANFLPTQRRNRGGLQPCSQGVLLDAFPAEKQGVAMTLFGLAALIAPVVGPTLGGWITDQYSWRWVFLINVPIGLLAIAACYTKGV